MEVRRYLATRGRLWYGLGWVLALGLSLSVIFGLYRASLGPLASQLYTTLARSVWALGLAWIRYLCKFNFWVEESILNFWKSYLELNI